MRALLLFVALTSLTVWAQKPVIKIGVVAPMSGNLSFLGEGTRDGVNLRLHELSKDSKFDYKFIWENDEYVFSRTAMAVKKLKEIDKVNIMVTLWGYGSSIALPLLRDSGIVHVSAHRWYDGVQALDYAVGESANQQADKTIELLKALGYNRISFIGSAEQGAEVMRKALERKIKETGLELVSRSVIPSEERDYRMSILKIKESKPDAIVQILVVPANGIFLKQLKELGVDIPVIHSSSTIFEVDPKLVEGSCTVYVAPPTGTWKQKFEAFYHRPQKYPAPQAYNCMDLILRACESLPAQKPPTGKEIAGAIENVKEFEGSTGLLHFVPPNQYEAPIAYWLFKDGRPQVATLDEIKDFYNSIPSKN